MFSLLNDRFRTGKQRARMCKFLFSLPHFFHDLWQSFSACPYLDEYARFRNRHLAPVGYRIAFLIRQPVLLRIRSGKD